MSRKIETQRAGILLLMLAMLILSLTLVACGHRANQDSVNNTNTSASQSIQSNQSTSSNSNQSTSNSSSGANAASNSGTGGNAASNGSNAGVKNTDQQVQNSLHALDGAQQDVNSSSTAAAQDQNSAP